MCHAGYSTTLGFDVVSVGILAEAVGQVNSFDISENYERRSEIEVVIIGSKRFGEFGINGIIVRGVNWLYLGVAGYQLKCLMFEADELDLSAYGCTKDSYLIFSFLEGTINVILWLPDTRDTSIIITEAFLEESPQLSQECTIRRLFVDLRSENHPSTLPDTG